MRLKAIDDGADRSDTSVYLRRVTDNLLGERAPWVIWRPDRLPRHPVADLFAAPHCNDHHDCCVAGQYKPQDMSWLDYFSAGRGVPHAWKRSGLLSALREIRYFPPSVEYLPYQVALQMNERNPSSLGVLPTRETQAAHASQAAQVSQVSQVSRRCERPLMSTGLRFILPFCLPFRNHPEPAHSAVDAPRQPLVTIIVCAYNEAPRIGWAIRSVLAQTRNDWELIAVDDGSTDGTAVMAEVFSDPRIRVARAGENRGKSRALNQALLLARGDYVLELDADDWLVPHAVETLCSSFETLCSSMEATRQTMLLLSSQYHLWRRSPRGELVYKGIQDCATAEVTAAYARVPIPRFYRTTDLLTLGGWPTGDPSQGRLFEDVAMTLHYMRFGRIEFLDSPLYHRVIHSGSVSQQNDRFYQKWIQNSRTDLP